MSNKHITTRVGVKAEKHIADRILDVLIKLAKTLDAGGLNSAIKTLKTIQASRSAPQKTTK